jgi:ADP-heptose:LPS heptosyltransferase
MRDSKSLRFTDRYLGGALCGLLSLPALIAPSRKPDFGKPRRILVIELFEMGAANMIAPSLSYLRQAEPSAELYCLTTDSMRESWVVLGLIPAENVFTINDEGFLRFGLSALRQVWSLRRMRLDLVIDYELFLRASAILVTLLGAKRRAGFHPYECKGLSRGKVYDLHCAFNQNLHIAKNFLALSKTAFEGRDDYPNFKGTIRNDELKLPEYRSTPETRTSLLEKLETAFPGGASGKRILVVSHDVGPNLAIRNYPVDRLVRVIQQTLAENRDLLVVLVGTQGESASALDITRVVESERCASLCGKTTFQELLELLQMASAVLCNDNGIGHFAALTRTRTVALFSTDSPFVYGPLGPCTILYSFFHCSPCISAFNQKNSRCADNKCLKEIPASVVADYVQRALEGSLIPGTVNDSVPYLPEA